MPFPRNSFANSNAKAEKMGKSWARSNLRGIQFRFTTWCSWCPSHILIIWGSFQTRVNGEKVWEGNHRQQNSNQVRQQSTKHDECILLRITISTLDAIFSTALNFNLEKQICDDEIWFRFEHERRSHQRRVDQRGKIAREWNNQHNRSFWFIHNSLFLTLSHFSNSFLARFFHFRFRCVQLMDVHFISSIYGRCCQLILAAYTAMISFFRFLLKPQSSPIVNYVTKLQHDLCALEPTQLCCR